MFRKAFFVASGVGLTLVLLFGRDAASYVSTTYRRLTTAVTDNVPVEFQIDRARTMVQDLEPEIRRSMHIIAKEEVALEQLNKQLETSEAKAAQDKREILHLQSDLQQNKSVYRYASRNYTADEVREGV